MAEFPIEAPAVLNMIDTYYRPGKAYTKSTYASAGALVEGFEDKPGKRIPKAGVFAGAGVGKARAEWGVCDAEAKGPNACAAIGTNGGNYAAIARAEVASASASAGPLKAKVGLAVDTGARFGASGVEARVLGTGFSVGETVSVSVLGNEVECCIS